MQQLLQIQRFEENWTSRLTQWQDMAMIRLWSNKNTKSTNPYQGQEARLAEQRLTKPTKAVSLSSSLSMSCANVFQQLKRLDGMQSYKIQTQIQIQILNFSSTQYEKLYVSNCAHILRNRNIQKQGRLYFGNVTACRYNLREAPFWNVLVLYGL